MHLIKPTLLLLALTISSGCVLADSQPSILESLLGGLGGAVGAVRPLLDGILGSGQSALPLDGDSQGNLQTTKGQLSQDLLALGAQITQALHNAATELLANFSSIVQSALQNLRSAIGSVNNRIKRNALQGALNFLEAINATTVELEQSLDEISEQADEHSQKFAAEIKEQWNDWAAAQLERVDAETLGGGSTEAEEIIDELQNRYTAYLHSCLEEFQVRQAQYEQKAHGAISAVQSATNGLIGKINTCLNRFFGSITCHRDINQALAPLQNAPNTLASLKLESLQILGVGLKASSCVAQTLADYALEKPDIERQLEEIIKSHQREESSSEESSSEENSDEENSDEESSSEESSSEENSEEESSSEESSSEESSSEENSDEESSSEEGSAADEESASEEGSAADEESASEEGSAADEESASEEGSAADEESASEEGSAAE
ncbi:uncharacterized protein LOC117901767 isoform X2 [Drosophila subobscura]|uniref:uncharacterized protein LOC117901767 isoform X2 n=1 Tax=Drosophila subobscura TaxID=7241 RepID=UPI00155B2679|nr:uncharacterized protein LOC117901767 isoform X2 [Drosophila subobscura]